MKNLDFQHTNKKYESTSDDVFLGSSKVVVLKMPRRLKRQLWEENLPAYKARMENARRKLAKNLNETSLQKLRLSKGLSQTKLAELIGSTQSHIAKIEALQISLHGDTLKKLANALEVPMETIYDLTKKPTPSTSKA